jgi:hypothetical protein
MAPLPVKVLHCVRRHRIAQGHGVDVGLAEVQAAVDPAAIRLCQPELQRMVALILHTLCHCR